jgi:hypothetical protein
LSITLDRLAQTVQDEIAKAHDQNTDTILQLEGNAIIENTVEGESVYLGKGNIVWAFMYQQAQVFQTLNSGNLTKIAFKINKAIAPYAPQYDIDVEIRNVVLDEGSGEYIPGNTVLGTDVILRSNITEESFLYELTLDTPISLIANNRYSVVLAANESETGAYWFSRAEIDVFPEGRFYGTEIIDDWVGYYNYSSVFKFTVEGTTIDLISNGVLKQDLGVTSNKKIDGRDISDDGTKVDEMYPLTHTPIANEIPTGDINNSNVTFTLAFTPKFGEIELYLNGLLQQPGSGLDYMLSGTTITFALAPQIGDIVLVNYNK